MKTNIKFAIFLPLLMALHLIFPANLAARDLYARDVVNPLRSFFSPLAFLEGTATFPTLHSIGSSSGLTMYEDEGHLIVEASLPGLEPEDIEVTFDRGSLNIQGKRKPQEEGQQRSYYHKSSCAYAYSVGVPHQVDESKDPVANYKNGLMTITFEKSQSPKPKKIEIRQS